MIILETLAKWVIIGATTIGLISTPVQAPEQNIGTAVPLSPALYDSYLASNISKTDTSMTLADGTLRNGTALDGFFCFTLDNSQPTLEYVCGTASSTSVTGLSRGVDVLNPNATSSALAYSHRRFSSVSISDFPTLQFLVRKANGTDDYDNPLTYSTTTPGYITSAEQLVHKGYVDAQVVASGVPATEVVPGLVEIASLNETKSGTATSTYLGNNYFLMVKNSLVSATSSATSSIPITRNDGKISQGFFDLTESFTFSGGTVNTGTLEASSTTSLSTTTIKSLTVSGTSTFTGQVEFNATTSGSGLSNGIGWIKLGETVLTAANATATVNITGTHKNYMIYAFATSSGQNAHRFIVFNGDNATNYGLRYSENGAADSSNNARQGINIGGGLTNVSSTMTVAYIEDPANFYKTFNGQTTILASETDTTPPNRVEMVGSYATTTRISSISLTTGLGTLGVGSYLTVYGSNN